MSKSKFGIFVIILFVLSAGKAFAQFPPFPPLPGDSKTSSASRKVERRVLDAHKRDNPRHSRDARIESSERTQWPDSSLGCPEPNRLYAQSIVKGWRVFVETDEETFEYHTDDDATRIVSCQNESTSEEQPLEWEEALPTDPNRLARLYVKALARELDEDSDDYRILDVEEVRWPDSSLGCAHSTWTRRHSTTPGLDILLRSGNGTRYEIHAERSSPGRWIECRHGESAGSGRLRNRRR